MNPRNTMFYNTMQMVFFIVATMLLLSCGSMFTHAKVPSPQSRGDGQLERIRISDDGADFVYAESGSRFFAWGVNYDHDHSGRLIEDYWHEEWSTVEEDFGEIKQLGANVVRVHLQVAKFMTAPDKVNQENLARLAELVALSERTGLYLDITGLGCYHKQDVPEWYDTLNEAARWSVQALFWESVAKTCAGSPAVFCYDLMNEPILPGAGKKETEWLAGEFGGKYFVQRITLNLAGRTREQVARAWVDTLVAAIRKHDEHHLVTVGVIPWAHVWPNAKPFFYSDAVGENLNFVSVHFYPRKGEVEKALTALAVYDVGKPLLVEEMFPLQCSIEEMEHFIDGARPIVDGFVSFYWGKRVDEYTEDNGIGGAITKAWLQLFIEKGKSIIESAH